MIELKRHLTQALNALSEEYEREQKRLSGQVEDLREQLNLVDRQVRLLAQDYRSLVEMLRQL